MELDKEKENIYGKMEEFLKECFWMENLMVKEKFISKEKLLLVNIKMVNLLVILKSFLKYFDY